MQTVEAEVIALNLVLIGIEADASYAQQKDHLPWAYVTERLFFFIYCFWALGFRTNKKDVDSARIHLPLALTFLRL